MLHNYKTEYKFKKSSLQTESKQNEAKEHNVVCQVGKLHRREIISNDSKIP